MGLSLRLHGLGGSRFVPQNALLRILERLKSVGVEYREPVAIMREVVQAECRFMEFHSFPSIEFPYSFLYLLRRLYVRTLIDPVCSPEPVGAAEDDDTYSAFLDGSDHSIILDSHLMSHGDADGIYLPVDFRKPVWVDRFSAGSVPRLDRELLRVGTKIGLGDDAALEAYLRSELDPDDPFEREKHALAAMREMCRLSMKFNTAVVFS